MMVARRGGRGIWRGPILHGDAGDLPFPRAGSGLASREARPRTGTGIRSKTRRRERGAALLIVNWLFIVLFVVVLDFATSMRDDGLATANFADETQSYYIALAGLNRSIYDVLLLLEENPDLLENEDPVLPETPDPGELDGLGENGEDAVQPRFKPDGTWFEGEFGGGEYSVRMVDEAARISLNRAGEPLLMRVVRRLLVGGNATEGVSVTEEREVSTIVGSIIDWRDPGDEEAVNGAEASYYASLARPYPIKNGPFDSVEELLQVRGVTPDLFYGTPGEVGLRDLFSVYNRSEEINAMQASPAVLRVLLNLDQEQAELLVLEREANAFGFVEGVREKLMAIDPGLAELIRGGLASVVTVEVTGQFGDRNVAHLGAVMDLSDAFEGPRVYRWFDRIPEGWGTDTAGADDEAADGA